MTNRLGYAGIPPEDQAILDREPPQDSAMGICLRAFRDLSTERPLGFSGYGPIPESKCREWCRYQGLDRESTAVIWAVVRRQDCDRMEREASEAALSKGA